MSHGILSFTYGGIAYTVYKATIINPDRSGMELYDLVFNAPNSEPGETLASAVYAYSLSTPHARMWEYQFGDWEPNDDISAAVHNSDWDGIILPTEIKEGLRNDVKRFFAGKEKYKALQVPWKRGILLLGPPGNGKTESIRALLKESEQPGLYVKTFDLHRVSFYLPIAKLLTELKIFYL
jgi:SpoVK/Ycf46/Vps4 family AAA+-type ATPase